MLQFLAQFSADSAAWLNNGLAVLVAFTPILAIIKWVNTLIKRVDQLETTVTSTSQMVKQQDQQIKSLEQNQSNHQVLFAETKGELKVLQNDVKYIIAMLEKLEAKGDR